MSKYQIVWKNPRYAMEISKPCTLLAINRNILNLQWNSRIYRVFFGKTSRFGV